jgi:hypothetical protein
MATPFDLKKLRDEILAEQMGDIAPAQERAADLSSRANYSRIGGQLANAWSGQKPSDSVANSLERQGQQGVQDAMRTAGMKSAATGEARQIVSSQQAAEKDAELDDPNAPTAAAAIKFYDGLQPGMGEKLKGMSYRQLKDLGGPAISKMLEQQVKSDAETRGNAEWDRRNGITSKQRLHEAEVLANVKASAPDKQPTVPGGQAADIGQLDAAEKMIHDLSKEWDQKVSGAGSGLFAKIPGTTAAQYSDNQLAKAQAIGTILEHGKLTDADLYNKYMKLVPEASDSPERKTGKIEQLLRLVQQAKASQIQGLTQAGYKTQGFQTAPAAAAPADAPTAPEEVEVIGPNGEEGTMSAAELAHYPDWKRK